MFGLLLNSLRIRCFFSLGIVVLCFQYERSSGQSLPSLHPTYQNFNFKSASGCFCRILCLLLMARIQFTHKRSALTASFSVRRPPNAPFVLSCPIRSFRKLNSRDRKNLTPKTQCLAPFQKNFVLLTCRLILRFSQFLTFGGGWGNSFSLYLNYEISITLSISLLRDYWAFPDSP